MPRLVFMTLRSPSFLLSTSLPAISPSVGRIDSEARVWTCVDDGGGGDIFVMLYVVLLPFETLMGILKTSEACVYVYVYICMDTYGICKTYERSDIPWTKG